jgi:hypothetical protein
MGERALAAHGAGPPSTVPHIGAVGGRTTDVRSCVHTLFFGRERVLAPLSVLVRCPDLTTNMPAR